MTKLVGLIPAAGKGVRARPYSDMIPKGMLKIGGRPTLKDLSAECGISFRLKTFTWSSVTWLT